MKSLRFAIIEDEPPARIRLKRLVAELEPDFICIAEAGDGLAGLALLREHPVDLLFLDIEFPPLGAFGLLREAREAGLQLPPIAFVTAFDQHALEAFRWAACDYLLKPVERERLRETLDRLVPAQPDFGLLLQALEAAQHKRVPERFTVSVKGRLRILSWAEVSHLSTENRLLFVYTAEGRFVLDRTLDELEGLLTPRFIRTHRGAMVALDAVKELVSDAGGTGELRLKDESRVSVSRDRMAELRRQLGG